MTAGHGPWFHLGSHGSWMLRCLCRPCKPVQAFISWQLTADVPLQMLVFTSHKSFIKTTAFHHLTHKSFQTLSRGVSLSLSPSLSLSAVCFFFFFPPISSKEPAGSQHTSFISHRAGIFCEWLPYPCTVPQIWQCVDKPDEARAQFERLSLIACCRVTGLWRFPLD